MDEAIYYFLELPWQIKLIWSLGLFFLALFFSFFLFLILSRIIKNRKEVRLNKIKQVLENLLAEVLFDEHYHQLILDEDHDGIRKKIGLEFLNNHESNIMLYTEIIKLHNSYKGELAEKLEAVFKLLDFDRLCEAKILSTKWYIAAEGILDANEMELVDLLPIISPLTNNDQNDLRTAAQNALINLNNSDPFSFFNQIKYPLSEWDQIQLHQALRKYQNYEVPQMSAYLSHREETVIVFSLKVIDDYKQEECFDQIVACLDHPSAKVQGAAMGAIISIDNERSMAAVINWLRTKRDNVTILRQAIGFVESQNLEQNETGVFTAYLEHENIAISVMTIEMLIKQPAGSKSLKDYIDASKNVEKGNLVKEIVSTYSEVE